MTQAQQTLDERKKELARKQAENDLLNRQIEAMGKRILELADSLKLGQEGLAFCEDLANSRHGAMKGKIETIVTEAVKMMYGDSYRVELTYSVKNNRSCLEIEMVRDTPAGEVRRDMEGFGGGMADTISVPLRLMVLMGSKQTDKVCVLDECWKHMNIERIEMVGKFLRLLSDKLGMQIVMCSHHDRIRDFADRTYEVSEENGTSKIEVF
jgi:DNA repair exonuclease SbcCD ATPase subunit